MLKKQVEFPILEPETSNKTAKKTHSAHTIDINTDDGEQAMGEELMHVQMSRWRKQAAI